MRPVGMSFVVCLVAAACNTSPEQERRDVCTAYCECVTSGLPSEVESCIVDDCLPEVPSVSDACLTCVYTFSQTCSDLFTNCNDLCLPNSPLLGGL